jgi:hypothetical protein
MKYDRVKNNNNLKQNLFLFIKYAQRDVMLS